MDNLLKQLKQTIKIAMGESQPIAEGGLGRILAHVKNDDTTFAMISAYRHENTQEENNYRTMCLTSDLVHLGLGFIKMEGGYIETVNTQDLTQPNTVLNVERSFFVGNITKQQAIELCDKYDQECVLFKDKDGLRYIDKDGNDVSEIFTDIIVDDNFTLNKIKDYFSRRLQGSNQRNYFKFTEVYVGIQNWNWGRTTGKHYDNREDSTNYIRII